ncbi:J domain-containing protein [Sorangium sp. So ce1000]|uniref:J domain-containing protein n=1 Tax=Sorangium sp. So ce1000 TaxID=3133325 RepID=UPI003F647AE9
MSRRPAASGAASRPAPSGARVDPHAGRARAAILRFTNQGTIWRTAPHVFLVELGMEDRVTSYELISVSDGVASCRRTSIGAPEVIQIDAGELERDRRAWCVAKSAYLHSHPVTWRAAERASVERFHKERERERKREEKRQRDEEARRQRKRERRAERASQRARERQHGAYSHDGVVDSVLEELWQRLYGTSAPPWARTTARPGASASDALADLCLGPGATEADVKKAFRRAALKAHPDHGGSDAAFIRLKASYDRAMTAVKEGRTTI